MRISYFSDAALPRQGIGSRGLPRATAYQGACLPLVYWITAEAADRPQAWLLRHRLPVPGGLLYRRSLNCAAGRPTARPPCQPDILDQQQAIYQEMLARQELPPESKGRALGPGLRPLSLTEITRDLAGWTTPPAGPPRPSKA